MSLELLTQSNTSPSSYTVGAGGKKTSRRPLPTWLVPLVILAGFAGVFTIVLWDDLQPAINVETARAIALPSKETAPANANGNAPETDSPPAKLLFQAAGWLEPDPMPVKAGSLINGTIEEILVTEGQLVQKGQLLARIDAREYKIATDQIHAAHMEAQATVRLREAEIKTAQANLQMEEASLAASLERLKRSKISYERYTALKPDTVSAQTVTDAEQELREQEKITLSNEAKIIASQTALEEARARHDSAIAAEKNASEACNKAQLDLRRCEIHAPINGRILRLATTTGARVNALSDDPEAGLVAVLYDPSSISLKMDVPLDQAGKLSIGQQARIRCEVFPSRVFSGKVVRLAGEADIQRNTLQARVKLDGPDDLLRPGMACRAEIFSPGIMPEEGQALETSEGTASSQPVLIPRDALVGNAAEASVWVVSLSGKLEHRPVKRDAALDRDGLYAIASGLLPGEPVVIYPAASLKEGATVKY